MLADAPVVAGLIIFIAYVAVVAVLWRVNRVDYAAIAASRTSVVRGLVVPIGAGLVLLAAATTALGWWPEVLSQPRTGPAWLLVLPVLFAVVAIVNVARIDHRALGASRAGLLAGGTLLVGAAEELLARGVLVVAAQEAGWSLTIVWLFSTALFSLLHAINVLFGMPWKAMLAQLVMSFLGGTVFFVTLMATGSLLVGVIVHALWDFGTLAHQGVGSKPPALASGGLLLLYLLGIAGIVVLLVA
ncbi:CPBP family intramembrane glutamic endopeptidase [Demequina lignilytica]|uniref:CPBP family intramembrane metalloprotease n=1 Tax=Demequina lignilytica TaxID=3051663 RepID=A0AB35MK47_9MICO|nr:CPBP family intramembrane glutamic endopeptidase [Demequina sp. SYSU T0a273]MDN4484148.1 CPBP family intramembrane metalloprotease [Demequina sp. SYSU T0a273]